MGAHPLGEQPLMLTVDIGSREKTKLTLHAISHEHALHWYGDQRYVHRSVGALHISGHLTAMVTSGMYTAQWEH